ncbi:MAG: amino acid adenylation protein [Verrucomicrobiales bacterium]|nr:amino acid adenylation protein [Verrucomicrobiales bacterium]
MKQILAHLLPSPLDIQQSRVIGRTVPPHPSPLLEGNGNPIIPPSSGCATSSPGRREAGEGEPSAASSDYVGVAHPTASSVGSESLAPEIVPAMAEKSSRPMGLIHVEEEIQKLARGIPAPLSYPQERLWFMEQLHPQSPVYNMTTAARLKGVLHAGALEKALKAVVERHNILHTRFFDVDGEPWQEVFEFTSFQLPVVDLSSQPEGERERELQAELAREARRPFNLGSDLLLRAILFRLSAEEHVLFLCMHHIASDAYSFSVFYIEVARLYGELVTGIPAHLSELPIQYADYAAWQRQELTQRSMQAHMDYWKQHLAGAPELLELPLDRPRPSIETFRGQKRSRRLPKELVTRLQKLGTQQRVTPFMLLLAAFKILLHRLSGQTDIVVGVPNMGRHQIQTEALVGFFINTLVLRSSLSDNPNFLEFLKQVRSTTLRGYTHQELPFEKLVEELRPERNSRHAPLVQVLFAWQSVEGDGLALPGLEVTHTEVPTGTAKLDLVATMTRTDDGLAAEMEFNEDLFEAQTIERWLGYWETLLRSIVANPESPVNRLALLPAAERERIVVEWNQTRRSYPQETSVSRLFEAQAAKTPNQVAITDRDRQVTYRELNERANQLARLLKESGLVAEQCAGIFLERSIEMVIAMLAVFKAKGAILPLDLSYPPERLGFMLKDSAAPLLISEERLLANWPLVGVRKICLEREKEQLAWQESRNLPDGPKAASPASVLYTSGSTGEPKGVCTTHRGIIRLVVNTDYARLEGDDVVAQASNCSFDAATWEIWGALLNGARLTIIHGDVLLSPKDLQGTLHAQGVTAMFLTTALFHQMALEAPGMFSGLHHLLAGGESMDPKCALEVLRTGPPRRLLNVYGPTETTTYATWHLVRDLPEGATHVPIGRPIANTTVYVLDSLMQPTPIGVTGEVYIGGDGLAQGYLNRPELTAARFVKDPFSSEPQARLYRTGDLARWRMNGDLEYQGRVDQQVKVRGYRVEPAEVEAILLQHPAVAQALVITRADATGVKQLAAYVVPKISPGPGVLELRSFLQQRLPEYMVPAFIVSLNQLPLSPNGKVDRRALPAPEAHGNAKTHCEPRNETERQLREIWEAVLQTRPIGITDKFFALGGHSLMAMRLLALTEKAFGARIPVATLFQNPTIEQMATFLGCKKSGAVIQPNSIVEIKSHGSRPPLMLVHGVGGGMFWGYGNLAKHLEAEQPVFAFKSQGEEGSKEFETIEEMAESYLADLKAFQPHGPYYIGGYCFGGIVAYEMARRLEENNEEVGLLALINSMPPNSSYMQFRWSPSLTCKFAKNVCLRTFKSLQAHPHKLGEYLRWRMRLLARRLQPSKRVSRGEQAEAAIDEFIDLSQYTEDQRKLWGIHVRALAKYKPKPFGGRVTLFRSPVHLLFCSFDPEYGWGDLALGGVDVRIIPGVHETIMEEPNVRVLAREMGVGMMREGGK